MIHSEEYLPAPSRFPAPSEGPLAGDHAALRRLMEAMRDGDTGALDVLIGVFWEPLVGYAADMLQNTDDASDVVQDCFVRLWQGRRERRGSGSVRALLYRMVRNRALDEVRSAKRRSRLVTEVCRGDERQPPRPDEVLAERELFAAVKRVVADLAPRRREVFLLAHLHGFSYREIADVLEISPQTAANQLCAALRTLRAAVGGGCRDSSDSLRESCSR